MSIRIRILFVLAAAWQLRATPPAWAGAQPAELCEAAKLKAASTFSQCRLKSDSVYAKTGDVTKREALYTKCDESLVKSYGAAESKYGAECPTLGDVTDVRDYLKQCSNDVGAATQPGGTVPDYVVDLAACNTSLSSMQAQLTTCTGDKTTCQGRLATAQSGTATTVQVLTGRTFTSSAGIGSTGTMPNNGAVTIPPGTSAQAIASGYHNGSGTVAGDANLTAGNIVAGRSIFGVSGSAAPLLKTGQTTSYGAGSDGAVQAGTAAKSFTDNGNGTVTDNRTGLVWAKKSDDGSIHDKDNTYTWGQSVSPYSMNGTMVTTYLATLNTPPCFAGACDWRMPNITELLSLVNYETFSPATFSAFNTGCTAGCTVTSCSCTVSGGYWSSSTYRDFPGGAWYVYFGGGDGYYDFKTSGGYVRAVRGGS